MNIFWTICKALSTLGYWFITVRLWDAVSVVYYPSDLVWNFMLKFMVVVMSITGVLHVWWTLDPKGNEQK